MIEVRTQHATTLRGRSPQTIARRLYGPRAWVRVGNTANLGIAGYVEATVLTPVPGDARTGNVRAVWLLDRVALDAYAAQCDEEDR